MTAMPNHRYLVSSDVVDDARRAAIARVLEAYGVRIQFSVFECVLTDGELRTMVRAVSRLASAGEDSIVLYECAACGQPTHKWLAPARDRKIDYWIS